MAVSRAAARGRTQAIDLRRCLGGVMEAAGAAMDFSWRPAILPHAALERVVKLPGRGLIHNGGRCENEDRGAWLIREIPMGFLQDKRLWWTVAVVVVVLIIGWSAGWFDGPEPSTTPPATTSPPATTTPPAATTPPATTPPATPPPATK